MGIKEDRDARLDALKEAMQTFLDEEKARIDRQISLIERLLESRGVGAITDNVLNSLDTKGAQSLSDYLTG